MSNAPTTEAELRAQLARLQEELAEAKRDAELDQEAAEDKQKEVEEWAATCKRLMTHNQVLQSALAAATRTPEARSARCGAVAVTTSGILGPCVVGWHHESFPHQDAAGSRWLTLVLPADAATDDLTQRLAAAYYLRFTNDGHPEDSEAAAEVAMSV
ncbi:hypothetical protein, partial [Streptomyces capuensis]|uniref:hypothetical protein n=1 Tax=Streptomyces capuensis TaxID=1464056 RepID=UPI00051808E0